MQKVDTGQAFAPGLAIVFVAIALDRITTGQHVGTTSLSARHFVGGVAGLATIATGAWLLGADTFPESLRVEIANPINDAVGWVNDNLRNGVPIIGGTGSISDFLVRSVLNPFRELLQAVPWWTVVMVVVAGAWASGGRRLAALCGLCMLGIAALRTWDLAMDTLTQVIVAVVLSMIVAIPFGILAGRSDGFERIVRPVLDAAQVLPAFVYLVPVIFLFNVGPVPGVIASVIYAVPPGIRLISLGLRQVAEGPREAARSFGATPRQELIKVQLPLAARSVLLGINQVILMVLSMVIVAALIGAGALGLETIFGLTKKEIGRGVAGGLSILCLAVVLDRITQAWGASSASWPIVSSGGRMNRGNR